MIIKGKFGSGFAEGKVWVLPDQKLGTHPNSLSALKTALEKLKKQLKGEQKRLGEKGEFLNFPLAMLQDPLLIRDLQRDFDGAFRKWQKKLSDVDDPYLRLRAQDLTDLQRRLLALLSGERAIIPPKAPFILFAKNLYVTDLLHLRQFSLAGVALEEGNEASHAVMLAHALGIPVAGQISDLLKRAKGKRNAIVREGELFLDEEPSEKKRINSASPVSKNIPRVMARSEIAKGPHVILRANVQLPEEFEKAKSAGAQGIGLFRTEFLWISEIPSLKKETEIYRKAMEVSAPNPVIFRLADLGSDKASSNVSWPSETNPALGWRGLQILLDNRQILNQQLQALFEAAGNRELQILLPMVRSMEEIQQFLTVYNSYLKKYPARARLGIMVETPSAAAMIPHLPSEITFISLGTNDLLQYFFAIDRLHPVMKADALNPLFVEFLKRIIQSAKKARKKICLCGELAGDPKALSILLRLGLREFSLSISKIPEIRRLIGKR